MPERIQLQRTKGWRLGDAVKVDRSTRWGNPFAVGKKVGRRDPLRPYLTRAVLVVTGIQVGPELCFDSIAPSTPEVAVAAFRYWLRDQPELVAAAKEILRGRDLGCWCPPGQPCHGDVWLEVSND